MEKTKQELPENAFRELKPGETYEPVMPSKANPREVTAWSLCLGLLMAVIFSAATAYLGLKGVRYSRLPSLSLSSLWDLPAPQSAKTRSEKMLSSSLLVPVPA